MVKNNMCKLRKAHNKSVNDFDVSSGFKLGSSE